MTTIPTPSIHEVSWLLPEEDYFSLMLIDGTLLPALPRMHWARWVNDTNRAAKLHLKFSVLRQAAAEALLRDCHDLVTGKRSVRGF